MVRNTAKRGVFGLISETITLSFIIFHLIASESHEKVLKTGEIEPEKILISNQGWNLQAEDSTAKHEGVNSIRIAGAKSIASGVDLA